MGGGRNYNHTLKLLFDDYRGQQQELTVGTLNFIGWKKLTVAIPPSILQTEYHYTYQSGIRITGLEIDAIRWIPTEPTTCISTTCAP